MEQFIIGFPSVTHAQKGQQILEKAGIRSRLTRAHSRGCSFGLEIKADSPDTVRRLLSENGVIFLP